MPVDEAYREVLRRLDELGSKVTRIEKERGNAIMAGEVEELNISKEGVSLRSVSLNTVLTLVGVVGIVGACSLLYQHMADAREGNAAFVGAIKELTAAQRDGTAVAREQNCLISMPQDRRDPELCRRVSGAPR